MTDKKIILGMALTDGYGTPRGAWRAPNVDPGNYVNIEANIPFAEAAERGKFALLSDPRLPGGTR